MKILFIVWTFPSLSETFVLNQMTGLRDRGHEVDIYASQSFEDHKVHEDIIRYGLLQRTTYYHIANQKRHFFLKIVHFLAACAKRDMSILPRAMNIFRSGRISSTFRLASEIGVLPKLSTYDVIYCHFGTNGNRGRMLREIGAIKGKLVTAFHGFDLSVLLRRQGENIYNQLFASGDLFLPISENWKKRLIELGCPEEKIIVHKMGIDLKRFSHSSRKIDGNAQIRLVSIARLVEKKGLEYSIRAVAKLIGLHKNIQYSIIGDGQLKVSLKKLILDLGVDENIKLLGWRPHNEIIESLDSSHILLAPSVTSQNGDQEGIPVALIEAMAMGLPVVSTYHSGIPELVQDGVSGFLVPERDVTALYEKLKFLIENPRICADMGYAGRTKVERDHDINILNDRLVKVLNEVAGGPV